MLMAGMAGGQQGPPFSEGAPLFGRQFNIFGNSLHFLLLIRTLSEWDGVEPGALALGVRLEHV